MSGEGLAHRHQPAGYRLDHQGKGERLFQDPGAIRYAPFPVLCQRRRGHQKEDPREDAYGRGDARPLLRAEGDDHQKPHRL